MTRFSLAALTGLSALAPPGALSQSAPVTSLFYPPIYSSPLPATPYWATPYWAKPGALASTPGTTVYPPNSTNLPPQLTNPDSNHFPMGAQTCSAPPYTCLASAPNTPGHACTCPTADGGIVNGVVR